MLPNVSPAEECLQHAADCDLKAETATDPEAKKNFIFLAGQWRRLAELQKQIGRSESFLKKSG